MTQLNVESQAKIDQHKAKTFDDREKLKSFVRVYFKNEDQTLGITSTIIFILKDLSEKDAGYMEEHYIGNKYFYTALITQ